MSEMRTRRTGRVGAVIVATVAFVAILAVASGTGVAGGYYKDKASTHQYGPAGDQYKPADDQYGGRHGKKLVICHKGRHTIFVSYNSWWAHKRHGSFLGRCDRASLAQWKLRRLEKQIAALEALLARLKEKQAKLLAEQTG